MLGCPGHDIHAERAAFISRCGQGHGRAEPAVVLASFAAAMACTRRKECARAVRVARDWAVNGFRRLRPMLSATSSSVRGRLRERAPWTEPESGRRGPACVRWEALRFLCSSIGHVDEPQQRLEDSSARLCQTASKRIKYRSKMSKALFEYYSSARDSYSLAVPVKHRYSNRRTWGSVVK